jgi:hypothetical protein
MHMAYSRATSRQLSYTRSMAAFAPTPHYVLGVEFGLFAKITDEVGMYVHLTHTYLYEWFMYIYA